MKKTLFLLVFLGAIITSYSQSSKLFFLKAGINSNTIKDNNLEESTISPYIGVGLDFGDKFSFQPELQFNIYKLNISNSGSDGLLNEDYSYDGNVMKISLPLLIKQEIIENFSIYTGITPSLILVDKDKSEINSSIRGTAQPKRKFDNNSSFNGAFTFGAEYTIKTNFFIEARYSFSPSFLNDTDDTVILSTSEFSLHEKSSIQFGIGYKLF